MLILTNSGRYSCDRRCDFQPSSGTLCAVYAIRSVIQTSPCPCADTIEEGVFLVTKPKTDFDSPKGDAASVIQQMEKLDSSRPSKFGLTGIRNPFNKFSSASLVGHKPPPPQSSHAEAETNAVTQDDIIIAHVNSRGDRERSKPLSPEASKRAERFLPKLGTAPDIQEETMTHSNPSFTMAGDYAREAASYTGNGAVVPLLLDHGVNVIPLDEPPINAIHFPTVTPSPDMHQLESEKVENKAMVVRYNALPASVAYFGVS